MSYVADTDAVLPPVAPFPLNAIVYVFAFHCAYNVTVAPWVAVRFFTTALSAYPVPVPSAFAFHPVNVYPVFVNPFAVKFFAWSYVIDIDAVLPPVAPFPLNAIVYVFAFHCAYNVTVAPCSDARFFTTALSAYPVPVPSAFVFHPVNVYPVFVNPFGVKFFSTSYVIDIDAVLPPVCVFPLNTIVYVFAVHCAYIVTSLSGVYVCPAFPIFSPPAFSVYHPLNVYPVLVVSGNIILLFL